MVSIPLFGDQNLNAKFTADAGIGVTVEILDITEESLKRAINQVLNNNRYNTGCFFNSDITRL